MSVRYNIFLIILGLLLAFQINAAPRPEYPIGGGNGFEPMHKARDAEIIVTSADQLRQALADGHLYIFISGTLDFAARPGELIIPDNVTLASDRGEDGSPGGRLRFSLVEELGTKSFATIKVGSNVTFTGLRVEGPTTLINVDSLAYGIQQAGGVNLTITNCEISGWPGAAISFKRSTGGQVKYNFIHQNRRKSRGYGVVVQNGNAQVDIMYNTFNDNRHAIAGSGKLGERYTAEWNLVGKERNGHAFDMHKASNGPQGGESVEIRNNIFDHRDSCWGYHAISIRAVPTEGLAVIETNWFKLAYRYACGSGYRTFIRGPGAPDEGALLAAGNQFEAPVSYDLVSPCSVTVTPPAGEVTRLPVGCESIGGIPGDEDDYDDFYEDDDEDEDEDEDDDD